jgi:starvation-inducible outer membrane lipoprotein
MRLLVVLIIAMSFTLTGCYTTCKYIDKAPKEEAAVQADTSSDA